LSQSITPKIIAFDVDGTLVQEQSSWVTIHQHFKTTRDAKRNLLLYNSGSIDYETFMKLDIDLWPKPLHVKNVDEILKNYTMANNAADVIGEIKDRGLEIVLISAGIDRLVCKVARTLDLSCYVANGLETSVDGYLTGNGIYKVDLQHKDLALKNMLRDLKIPPKQCIAVGDSRYDLTFLQYAGKGIAVCSKPDPVLKDQKKILKVSELRNILDLI
jgi:HAD superfamily PSPase-like hydrolase